MNGVCWRYGKTVMAQIVLAGKARYNWWRTCSKSFFKEDWTPNFADKRLFTLAPAIAMFGALASLPSFPYRPHWGQRIGTLAFYFSLPWQVWRCMR